MVNRHITFFKALNLAIDYILLNISMLAVFFIQEKMAHFWLNKKYLTFVVVFNLIWLLSSNITGLYEQVLNKDSVKTFRSVIRTYLLFISIISFTVLIILNPQPYAITREYSFYCLALFGFLLSFWKLIFLSIRFGERASLIITRDVIIVGGGRIGHDLHRYFKSNPDQGYKTAGFFDDNPANIKDKSLYLGATHECINYVIANKVDEIFCTLPVSESKIIEKLMLDADKNLIRFKSVPQYYDYSKRPTSIQIFGNIPIISVRIEPLENLLNRLIKRAFDCFFSVFVILFIFSWFFPILGLIIKLTSKGPVFFVQTRSGRDSKPFKCYKFRSMVVNNNNSFTQATKNDHRVTKIGKILRKTSLDELPQFFNVLIGNMSVVGPRPHPIELDKEYENLINTYMVRHFIKPGITGWAQVINLRGETTTPDAMARRVEADVWYLENWSFLLDLKIIFLTFWNIVKGDENAF